MLLLAHRFVRGVVFGVMLFLAGTAYCTCDSYDPDPYDDTPPVVTVEFNYVVPSRVSIRRPNAQTKNRLSLYSRNKVQQVSPAELPGFPETQVELAFRQSPPQWAIPLRR
jgi:hypothetical protein